MKVQPAAFLRTTLPLGIDMLEQYDSGRYHSIWLPDHMVSFWPDSIWTPEFTDLATVSPSPHRHLDGMAVAAAAAVLTNNTPIVTTVVDTVRRHPAMLAQTARDPRPPLAGALRPGPRLGRTGEHRPVWLRLPEAGRPVRGSRSTSSNCCGSSDGPVDFDGQFYHLEHARLDTELYDGKCPPIWIGAAGPRMLRITGRHADGWWPNGRVHAGGLRREARGRPRGGRAGRPRPDGHRSGGDPDLPHRRRRRGRGDARRAAGQGRSSCC